jgi:hypothetical protein
MITNFHDIYIFYHEKEDSILIQNLTNKIADKVLELEKFFKIKPISPVHIYLTKNNFEFQNFAKKGLPEWARAVAFTNTNTIVLLAGNADEINQLPGVLMHELVHIYLGIVRNENHIPTWLHEGLAQYLSNDGLSMEEQILIANALFADKFLSLTEMDSMFSFKRNQAQIGYALARSAVDFFVLEFGLEKLHEIIIQLSGSRAVNDIFIIVTARDFIDFEIRWYKYIDKEYSWFLIMNVENLIWVFLVILLFAAFIRIKFKNRKTVSSWNDDFEIGES